MAACSLAQGVKLQLWFQITIPQFEPQPLWIFLFRVGRVTNIPGGMVTDQFGMIGLLTFIRAAETDPGMVHLALGSDLTTLGLNLNSPE